ncbi:helix-turn-helix transcriptional regulator [Flavobacterium sp. Fl-77]|uniref:Helix-turn-helix transcriptional regulator n=1 Tax=Flavobacterium flavipigmentatum TaxID=2893884 RepID=A0AAJ2SK59_9FLAO|nr:MULTISPECIES: helix-turn-helix transcriptional regulator [unclassified Flavobacterium]MDX6184080.1 helix-turn-helix transcriptional regulator [Flavobacterium sp. Fl-33]MDX6187674.1 helix-turn-helix transcriptional regulator [Flavobacterium sp. Fl-77]UFH39192.1 helix-turn-helix transcriptional regulator [Flavobacterium sp. F-70]
MTQEIQKLHDVWISSQNKAIQNTTLPKITFDDLTNSIISTGPFYYYIVDFFDMSLSHVSPSIREFHDFDSDNVSFNDILGTIHPDDIEFVTAAEAAVANFFYNNIGREQLLKYKISYNLRGKLKNGEYVLCNHQALILTMDDKGGYGKSLNIHTRIDHLATHNNYQFSLIGLDGEPSYMNLNTNSDIKNTAEFSKREIDIIKNIADGLSSIEIAEKLFISDLTVKKHRKNILSKSACKNTAQLVKTCILQGVI